MTQHFAEDIKWRLGNLTVALCAMTDCRAVMMVIRPYTPKQKHATWLVYFDRSEDGVWVADKSAGGLRVYDTTASGPFVELQVPPQEVPAAVTDALQRLQANDLKMVNLGKVREHRAVEEAAERRSEAEAAALRRVEAILDNADLGRAQLLSFARRHLGDDFSLDQVEPDDSRPMYREVIDLPFGPMVLTITGPVNFTLSTPGQAPLIDEAGNSLKFDAGWTDGTWKNAPTMSANMMEQLDAAAVGILADHADRFEQVTRMLVANRLSDIAIEESALTRYGEYLQAKTPTLPSVGP